MTTVEIQRQAEQEASKQLALIPAQQRDALLLAALSAMFVRGYAAALRKLLGD